MDTENRGVEASPQQNKMATSQMTHSMEDLLNCSVCLERYSVAERMPKMLPCQHTICQPCLQKLITRDVAAVTCPICRRAHDISQAHDEAFENNRLVLQLLERPKSEACEMCKASSSSECLQCMTKLCIKCSVGHFQMHAIDDKAREVVEFITKLPPADQLSRLGAIIKRDEERAIANVREDTERMIQLLRKREEKLITSFQKLSIKRQEVLGPDPESVLDEIANMSSFCESVHVWADGHSSNDIAASELNEMEHRSARHIQRLHELESVSNHFLYQADLAPLLTQLGSYGKMVTGVPLDPSIVKMVMVDEALENITITPRKTSSSKSLPRSSDNGARGGSSGGGRRSKAPGSGKKKKRGLFSRKK